MGVRLATELAQPLDELMFLQNVYATALAAKLRLLSFPYNLLPSGRLNLHNEDS